MSIPRLHRAEATGAANGVPLPLPKRREASPRAVLAVASFGVFMAFVDATIVNIAFPDIQKSFPDSDISSLSWVLNAYNIVFAAFLVTAGRFADLFGRRRMFSAGLVVFTIASALCAIAPSVGALVAFRVLQAFGAALLVPASLGLVLQSFPPERRAHAVALQTAVAALAAGVGPSLGGLLVSASDWRLVFLVNIPVGVAAFALTRRYIVESRAPGRRRMPDVPGALMFAATVAALVLAVVKGEEWGWTGPEVLGSFAVAIVLGTLFVRRCAWHPEPLLDLTLLRIRAFAVANALSVIAAAGFFGYTLCNVLFLTSIWQYSVLDAGLALTPGPFVAAAVAGPASRVAERFGPRPVLVVGGLLWGGAVLWLVTQVGTTPAFVEQWLPGMVLLGMGAGILFPTLSAAAIGSIPGERFGTATGLNSVARQLGAALGVALVVAILGTPAPAEAPGAFDNAWIFCAACLLAAGVGSLGLGAFRGPEAAAVLPSLGSAARAVLVSDVGPESAAAEATRLAAARRAKNLELEAIRQMGPETISDFLAAVPLLAGVSPEIRDALAERARVMRLGAGEWLFRQDDPGDALYVVRAGRLLIMDERTDSLLGQVGRGGAVGELALLTDEPRAASICAARDSDLIAIDRADFERLLAESHELALALTRTLGSQLRMSRGARDAARPAPSTVAFVPLQDGLPVDELSRELRDALALHLNVGVLDGSEVAPPGAADHAAAIYGPLLDRLENDHDRMLLVTRTPDAGDPWTGFVLQQADRVLGITAGGPVPERLTQIAALQGCDLVAYDVATGSGALEGWADALNPTGTHTLRSGAELVGGVQRIARRLTGTSVGVVLSGGGARAFSHIGAIEELLASGIVIDRVAGVSMGAYLGAMLALGMNGDEMDARCHEEFVRRRPLGDYTLPRYSLIRGARFEGMLDRTFGTATIEELDRSFVCASADLRGSELVLHRHGLVRDHVGTSMCMPILAPPQVRGRQLLVDGSLIDNLPVAAMAELGEGPLIAIDVKASFERPAVPAANGAVNGAANGAANGNGRAPGRHGLVEERTPGLGETLTRVLLLASSNTSDAASRHAVMTIKPRNEGIGLLEFHQLDRAREAGRAAARDALEDAPAQIFG